MRFRAVTARPDPLTADAHSLYVSHLVEIHYPLIYERFKRADPGFKNPDDPLRARFGVFPLFCLNYTTDDKPVHCRPHVDFKNVAGGVCVVMPYGERRQARSVSAGA